ncbi:hypothetical protein IKF33_02410 [Candidatus Saccharibacteria bacterium]|nr:hypothetical protein [Candidatus Saccharibacteria bacterium]
MLIRTIKFIPAIMAILLGGLFCFSYPAAAEGEEGGGETPTPDIWLQISPVSKRVKIAASETQDGEFTVENIGAKDFDYKVYATPYYATSGETYDWNFTIENSYTQIARWITFADKDGNYGKEATFNIKKGEKQTIKYRITTPDSIPSGGQYAALFAQSLEDNTTKTEGTAGIKTISRVGMVLYAKADGDTRDVAEISNYSFDKFKLSGNLKATATIKNDGNTDFTTSVNYTVKTLFGKELYTLPEGQKSYILLPETERTINVEWADTPFMGIFQVNYKVSALDQVKDQTSIVLVLPIFVGIIALLLLTIIVIWAIILIRKRGERKSRLLV